MTKAQEDLIVYAASFTLTWATYAALVAAVQYGAVQGYLNWVLPPK